MTTSGGTSMSAWRGNSIAADSAETAGRLADTLFAIALGAAACRQWLAQDPPRLDEVDTALHSIAAAAARFQNKPVQSSETSTAA